MYKQKLLNIKNGFDRFLFSDLFIVFAAGVVFLFHVVGSPHIGILLLAAIVTYTLFTQKDLLPLAAVFMLISYMLPQNFETQPFSQYIYLLFVLPPPIIGGIVFFFIKNRNGFKRSRQLLPCVVFCSSLLVSGLFSAYYFTMANFVMIVQMIVSYFAVIILLFNGVKKLTLDYVAKLLLAAGIVISLELLIYYFKIDIDFVSIITNKDITLGWAVSNNIGITLGISLPAAFYLAHRYSRSKVRLCALIASGFLIFTVNYLTMCRGSILICTVFMPVLLILPLLKQDKKTRIVSIISYIVYAALILIVVLLILENNTKAIFERLKALGFGDSNRFNLWREAISAFIRYPIFGVGYGYTESYFVWMYAVHNTVLQFLASGGIIGLCAAIWFFGFRYKLFLKKRKFGYLFFLISVLTYELYGLIDLTPFYPYLIVTIALIFMALEHSGDEAAEVADVSNSVAVDGGSAASESAEGDNKPDVITASDEEIDVITASDEEIDGEIKTTAGAGT